MLRKWYFAVNEMGFQRNRPLMRVAIASCLANTQLEPICLYNGADEGHVAELEAWGARVVRHKSRLEAHLRKGYGDKYDQFSGHWLRVDIPWIEQEEDVVLYTDTDVMFLRQPRVWLRPVYLAAAPERYRWRWPHFNSGVMVLNLPRMRAVYDDFAASIDRRMDGGWREAGHDQVSYNTFFKSRRQPLAHTMNWKPYWGVNENARIIHFHGPKPANITHMREGRKPPMRETYQKLWSMDKAAYDHYCALFQEYLDG